MSQVLLLYPFHRQKAKDQKSQVIVPKIIQLPLLPEEAPGFKSQQPGLSAQDVNLHPIQCSQMTPVLEVFLSFGATQFHLVSYSCSGFHALGKNGCSPQSWALRCHIFVTCLQLLINGACDLSPPPWLQQMRCWL